MKALRSGFWAVLMANTLCASAMAADTLPTTAIKIEVAASSGGALDLVARAVSDRLSIALRQPIVIENKTGADGNLVPYSGRIMGQVLHGSATTTHAIRTAMQRSKAPLKGLAVRYGFNQKTVAKWRKRNFVHDAPMGPKASRSTVLSVEEGAVVVAFRRHTLLHLDDCLYALQAAIPHPTRSSLHRCLQRHGISRLPDVGGDRPARKKFQGLSDRLRPYRYRGSPTEEANCTSLRRWAGSFHGPN